MFLSIINWLRANTPGFMRPAINWLVTGLRNITSYIAGRWNTLGGYILLWHGKVVFWGGIVSRFAYRLYLFVTWLVRVRIPGAIAVAVDSVRAYLTQLLAAAKAALEVAIATLRQWAREAVDALKAFINSVKAFAEHWINRIREYVNALVNALTHVLNGPAVLAEWLIAAMVKALLRYVYAQRDRIFTWLLRESKAFTLWLAREVEELIVRML